MFSPFSCAFFAENMSPKQRRSTGPPTSKHAQSVNTTANDIVVPTASINQLLSLTTRVLCSHLQAYSLPTSGNKETLADCLYHHFHTPSQQVPNSTSNDTDVSAPLPLTTTGSTENPPTLDRGVFFPQQFTDQLSDFLRHLVPATSQSEGAVITTTVNQPPTTTSNELLSTSSQLFTTATSNQTRDEILSAALPTQSLSSGTAVNHHATLINHGTTNRLPTLINWPSTIGYNPTIIANLTHYLPPVSPKIREHIIKGEFIDFVILLPKAMFSSSMEPDCVASFTVQLPFSSGDISVRPATKPKTITSFSNWMEAWNIFLAVCIDHMPSCAPSLVAY